MSATVPLPAIGSQVNSTSASEDLAQGLASGEVGRPRAFVSCGVCSLQGQPGQ